MPFSDEQKKAASDRMKAYHAAKKEAHPEPAPLGTSQSSSPDYGDLLALVKELKTEIDTLKAAPLAPKEAPLPPQQQTPQVNRQGGLTGTFEKYVLDPNYYSDPTPRLAEHPKLQRFAFPINYELEWKVTDTFYETVDGVRTREPRFTVELNRVMLDEESGEDTGGRYTIRSFVFHEDPQAALVVAREQGVDVSSMGEREFLDEMRYLRVLSWLLEAFYPPKRDAEKKNKKEMAINGKIVQYFEVSSPNGSAIPFKDLDGSKV
jgi:hypothetical protein